MARQDLVVIGNGMAGARVLEELLSLAPDQYQITVFGAEPYGNYNRILLSQVLAGGKRLEDIMLNTEGWYASHGITLFKGRRVVRIDRRARRVTANDGMEVQYDRLILATGSEPIRIPVPGSDLAGVMTFRDIGDVEILLEASRQRRKAAVIGGGLLGLEAAHGLLRRGMEVCVIHLCDRLMEHQLDHTAAQLLEAELERRGMKILTNRETIAITGRERVASVLLKDGGEVEAELVIMAVGIRPNIALAQVAGLNCCRGILVNDLLQTSDENIYAVGECAEHQGVTYGLFAPLYEQAKVCAQHLAGMQTDSYCGSVVAISLKVTGIELFSGGNFMGDEGCQFIVLRDGRRNVYRKLVIKEERLIGALLYGDSLVSAWYTELIREHTRIASFRSALMFGPDFLPASGWGKEGILSPSGRGIERGEADKSISGSAITHDHPLLADWGSS